jgi:excisionase family DNA binding protein
VPKNPVAVRDVSLQYGVSEQTVRRKIKKGELFAYRCGPRLIKLDADQVEAAMLRPATPAATNVEAADRAAAYIEKLLAEAPELTDEQRSKLAELLRPARATARNGGVDHRGAGRRPGHQTSRWCCHTSAL